MSFNSNEQQTSHIQSASVVTQWFIISSLSRLVQGLDSESLDSEPLDSEPLGSNTLDSKHLESEYEWKEGNGLILGIENTKWNGFSELFRKKKE